MANPAAMMQDVLAYADEQEQNPQGARGPNEEVLDFDQWLERHGVRQLHDGLVLPSRMAFFNQWIHARNNQTSWVDQQARLATLVNPPAPAPAPQGAGRRRRSSRSSRSRIRSRSSRRTYRSRRLSRRF